MDSDDRACNALVGLLRTEFPKIGLSLEGHANI